MNLYQLYANPEELKWANAANNLVPEIFALDDKYLLNTSKKYTPDQIKSIAKDPEIAFAYAYIIIDGRFAIAEPYIMKDPEFAYCYAKDIIKGRWKEAEPFIIKNLKYTYKYARYVLKHRWIEAEKYIKTDNKQWNLYKKYFKIIE